MTGCWGFPSLSPVSLLSSLFFHVEVIHCVSFAAEGFRWGNESARSARADKRGACLLSVTHSALSNGMYYFFPVHSHPGGECGRTKCHHCGLSFCRDLLITLHTLLAIYGVAVSQDLCKMLRV